MWGEKMKDKGLGYFKNSQLGKFGILSIFTSWTLLMGKRSSFVLVTELLWNKAFYKNKMNKS